MNKCFFYCLFVILMGNTLAQYSELKKPIVPLTFDIFDDENNGLTRFSNLQITTANYIAVDTMHNSFSPASNSLNPLAYDPVSNVLAVVHGGNGRTYASSSGELWWNYSTDMGLSWVRSNTSVQDSFTTEILSRYPSMSIKNPSGSINLNDIWGVFAWPELDGFIGYGFTIGMEESEFAGIDFNPPSYGVVVPIFTDENYSYWAVGNTMGSGLRLFRTNDFLLIDIFDPPTWNSARFSGAMALGGVSYNGSLYVGLTAAFTETIGASGWEVGYSKSTDQGNTWSDWYVVDWRQIPLTANYDELWDWKKGDEFVSYAGDIQVDKYGYVHIICGLTDTVTATEFGYNAVVEFFETSAGIWDAKILAEGSLVHDNSIYEAQSDGGGNPQDPGIGQCGPSFMMASNWERDFFVTQWIIGSPETSDTLCDIYFQTRSLEDPVWSSMVNLTETNSMNEDGAHLAPNLAENTIGNTIKTYAFSMFWYEAGNTGPLIDINNPSVIYAAPVLVKDETVQVEGDLNKIPTEYALLQNYPNPFNPNTKIKFQIIRSGWVNMQVYDVLGNEVTTLVNKDMQAGSYEVNFDGSGLTTGVYFYKLIVGLFVEIKKMVLLR